MTELQERRPEQQFFPDPATDRLMSTVMTLATELFVLRASVRSLENALVESGAVDKDALDCAPADAERQRLAKEAAEYADHLLRPLLGVQDAAGPVDPTGGE